MPNDHGPFYPIIYVRGYAMTRKEIDDTTADPFCGFNIGSTVYRAVPEKNRPPRKFIFESPVLRLASDFDYRDVYEDGYDITDPDWELDSENRLTPRSIIVYRYYDEASSLLGVSTTPSIETFSKNLGVLIMRVRELVCANPANKITPDAFRCYLVAHSMGGLVCRGLLQNPRLDPQNARRFVDKFFTYATPHNGIDIGGINVPGWVGLNDINNFSRPVMAKYLALEDVFKASERVDCLPASAFSGERVFCMVGTNRMDYEAAAGASRTFVGHGSDGLVRIENATLESRAADGTLTQCAKAFTYRTHSGFFGIVNSEEAYQNLTRFLFGDVRVDIWLDIDAIRLPTEVQEAADKGKQVNALYQVEAMASPRGKLWYLTRRMAEEDSVACVTHADWKKAPKKNGTLYLSTVFLANRARVNKRRRSLAYSLQVGVRVPDYEIERALWVDKHYEGGYLFRNALLMELTPPRTDGGKWKVQYSWQNQGFSVADTELDAEKLKNGKVEVKVPFDSTTTPGLKGQVRFVISAWN